MTIYSLDGRAPEIDPDTWIAPDANVIGDVVLEAGVSVWFGAALRGDNEPIVVGAGSNIQENSTLHTDMGHPLTIGPGCTIGHLAIVHGCTVGQNTLIGMGATVMNGAVIGDNCLIGARAVVTEGKEIPSGSLVVGAPGRVVRSLDETAIEGLRESARNYQRKLRRYRDGLVRITD